MQITKIAVAGTLESSDAQVRIEPANTLNIELNSSVGKQFGDDILATIKEVLAQFDVNAAQVTVEDKGALDCVLRARLKAALLRATDEQIDWGKVL
ncbi:citrate lyase acyl carrier protein [Actinobacillus equuli subsp. equuli]|uniref:Citrate lyase acyl carrier protein n=4 Tax=Actinobacillus TaxID=713 RepID=A0A0A7MEF1_ACTEU|nr:MULTISPECIES: citrate lyase acyl carrier protein [Actinobacillus]AFU19030.1 citrate lyase subunit gamma [Actinobacillus suis H91-0380]AIJ31108.1 citrate lyase subunit gamma [Actinobacillus suis ATCC 33415]AIZ79055.1 citrate lyase subunit gamma [Actinobacillus equuli subsp. equuli]MCO4168538.1 citrate lyase acyl carrier protein [Actinobacillus suis]MCQ9628757.1 citrate lyase acyl carrier protein [Actinobacillus suis]